MEYPIFIISEGSKPRNPFELSVGQKSRETVRTKLGSFSVEETPSTQQKQPEKYGHREKGSHAHGTHKHQRKKHKRKDMESNDRRKRISEDYDVV